MKLFALIFILPVIAFGQSGNTAPPRAIYASDLGFHMSMIVFMPLDAVPASKLNVFPKVEATARMRYPKELLYTGFVGHIFGAVAFGSDGKVIAQQVTGGNSSLLMETAAEYVQGLKFADVFVYGKPVSTMIDFELFITEEGTYGPFFEHSGRAPNAK